MRDSEVMLFFQVLCIPDSSPEILESGDVVPMEQVLWAGAISFGTFIAEMGGSQTIFIAFRKADAEFSDCCQIFLTVVRITVRIFCHQSELFRNIVIFGLRSGCSDSSQDFRITVGIF